MDGILGLIERVFPEQYHKLFQFETTEPQVSGIFEIDGGIDDDGRQVVIIRADSVSSQAAAIGYYIKYFCKIDISWCGSPAEFPKTPPIPESHVEHRIAQKYRAYLNYCTFSYSMAFWNWERWEKEIDFMALSGINMPLTVVGTEVILYYALTKHKFSDREALEAISSPAYYAWQLMGNLDGIMPVVEKGHIERRMKLGKRIIERERELGMSPVMQGFSGVVPAKFKEKYPSAKTYDVNSWAGHAKTCMIDPLDPLFYEFGMSYLNAERELFGAVKHYATDPFHENQPPQKGNKYLKAVGKSILRLYADFDSESVWVIQSWSLRKNMIKSLPKGKILVFDINGEKYKNNKFFFGHDFVIGVIGNFGGRSEIQGDIKAHSQNKFARINKSNLVGTGIFPEAIETNPLYFELVLEMGITENKIELESWLANYAERRYGLGSENAYRALSALKNSVYRKGSDAPITEVVAGSIISARPTVDRKSQPAPWSGGLETKYDNMKLIDAFKVLYSDFDILFNSDAYCYDIVDFLRQIMTNIAKKYYSNVMDAYEKRDLDDFKSTSAAFLELLADMDELLKTRPEFDFYNYLYTAQALAETYDERLVFDKSARALYTVWGPIPESAGDENVPQLFDYACHEMSGLISDFYAVRWKMFFDMLIEKMDAGVEYNPAVAYTNNNREGFFSNEFYEKLGKWELSFIKDFKEIEKPNDRPNLETTVRGIIEKYLP